MVKPAGQKIESLLLKETWQLMEWWQLILKEVNHDIFLAGKPFATVISDESPNEHHVQYSVIIVPLIVLTTTDWPRVSTIVPVCPILKLISQPYAYEMHIVW